MTNYQQIFENNRQWLERNKQNSPDFMEKLSKDQTPEFLYIGCSDSRVLANDIMGLAPGEVFVHRNIANVVPTTDINSAAVIDYAVSHLKVKHVVVCGHYGCGGVKAAMQPKDLGILNPWLRNIRDVYRIHSDELNAISDTEERYRKLVELNVIEQCINVIKQPCIQQRWEADHEVKVHGWVFDLETGLIKDLEINFEEIMHKIQEIYNLTEKSWI